MQTKIMNEGWAAYWHARIMRELALTDDEFMQFAALHSSVLAPSRRRHEPLLRGLQDVRGHRAALGRANGRGTRAARTRTAATAAPRCSRSASWRATSRSCATTLTKELVDDLDLYLYRRRTASGSIVEKDWRKVRDSIVASMTNFGQPYIVIEDGDYKGNRELYLRHRFEGQELDHAVRREDAAPCSTAMGTAGHLETVFEEKPTLLTFDGQACNTRAL